MESIRLKKGKEKSVLHRHPWLFSGAIDQQPKEIADGDIVKLLSSDQKFLAYGYYNSRSKISFRLLEWDENKTIDLNWWKLKIDVAIDARKELINDKSCNCLRLIFSESDKLPGLIVDKFDTMLVVQVMTSGVEKVKNELFNYLKELLNPNLIVEKSDSPARVLEGLEPVNRIVFGDISDSSLIIIENNLKFSIDAGLGQKSGFFLDQRENRKILADFANGKNVLDCFCYTGAFSINALQAGALSVTGVDSSAFALNAFEENLTLNKFDEKDVTLIEQDVFNYLRTLDKEKSAFDLIILDPPKLAPSRSSVDKAKKAYKDLNLQALKILKPGGMLATFSCSAAVDLAMLKQLVAWAATDAGVDVQFVHYFSQPTDHPIISSFPESEYLKGILCKVI